MRRKACRRLRKCFIWIGGVAGIGWELVALGAPGFVVEWNVQQGMDLWLMDGLPFGGRVIGYRVFAWNEQVGEGLAYYFFFAGFFAGTGVV